LGKILLLSIVIGALAGILIPTKMMGEIIWWCIKTSVKLAIFLFFTAVTAFLTYMIIALWDA
jgi:hypothetical protein